jgi:uncharacterized protein YcfL
MKRLLALLLTTFFLVSCGAEDPAPTNQEVLEKTLDKQRDALIDESTVYNVNIKSYVTELQDGRTVECVVFHGRRNDSMECDFR